MRKWIAIGVATVVGASCIPWVRNQHFFSLLVGASTVIFFVLIVFGVLRTLLTRSQRTLPDSESARPARLSPNLSRLLVLGSLFIVLVLVVPHFLATSTGSYKLAVATARKSPQFTDALGSPVKEGWFSEGKSEWGDQARSEIVIPVYGQKRTGKLRALAIKEGADWRLQELTLELARPADHIDLLSAQPGPR